MMLLFEKEIMSMENQKESLRGHHKELTSKFACAGDYIYGPHKDKGGVTSWDWCARPISV